MYTCLVTRFARLYLPSYCQSNGIPPLATNRLPLSLATPVRYNLFSTLPLLLFYYVVVVVFVGRRFIIFGRCRLKYCSRLPVLRYLWRSLMALVAFWGVYFCVCMCEFSPDNNTSFFNHCMCCVCVLCKSYPSRSRSRLNLHSPDAYATPIKLPYISGPCNCLCRAWIFSWNIFLGAENSCSCFIALWYFLQAFIY